VNRSSRTGGQFFTGSRLLLRFLLPRYREQGLSLLSYLLALFLPPFFTDLRFDFGVGDCSSVAEVPMPFEIISLNLSNTNMQS
jgi:hypothetical protein